MNQDVSYIIMEFKEKLSELEKSVEKKLVEFEKETGMKIHYVSRPREGFKISISIP